MNVCEQCGKEFEPTRGKNRVQKYCSRECYHQSTVGHVAYNVVDHPIVVCARCGKEFETGGRGKPTTQRFCSKQCQAFARVRKPKTNEMTVAQAAYLAGLVDGEGSIIAVKRNSEGRHTWRLQVANTQLPLLDWCIEATGVGTIVTSQRRASEKHQLGSWWQCYSWNAYDVLRQIAPYMIIKRDLALRMMAELDTIVRLSQPPDP